MIFAPARYTSRLGVCKGVNRNVLMMTKVIIKIRRGPHSQKGNKATANANARALQRLQF